MVAFSFLHVPSGQEQPMLLLLFKANSLHVGIARLHQLGVTQSVIISIATTPSHRRDPWPTSAMLLIRNGGLFLALVPLPQTQ